jgi:Ca-activated chloride channel family protein
VLAPQPTELTQGRLRIEAAMDQSALLQGSGEDRFLVIEVGADAVEGAARRPVHLSVVMDTSGSMSGQGKMSHARAAAQELVGLLGPEDTFSLVTFDDQAAVRLPDRPVTDASSLQRRIQGIQTGGGTNLYDGVESGLDEVRSDPGEGVRRVVVLSDGNANIGITDSGSLRRQAGSLVAQGVTISAIGIGVDYNEDLLAAMADAGGGAYRFVGSPGSLTAMFTEAVN